MARTHRLILLATLTMGLVCLGPRKTWAEEDGASSKDEASRQTDDSAEEADEEKDGEEKVISRRVISRRVVRRRVVRKKNRDKDAPPKESEPAATQTAAPRKASAAATSTSAVAEGEVNEEVDVIDERSRDWRLRAEAVTDFPLQLGGGILIETPSRLRLKTSLGIIADAYLSSSNAIAQSLAEDYPDDAATLVESSLEDSFVWRTQAGFRPFRRLGLYGHLGYSFVRFGGGATGAALVEAATGFDDLAEQMEQGGPRQVDIDSTLHMLDAEVGWEFGLTSWWSLRLGLGWAYTFSANTEVVARFDAESSMEREDIEQFERNASDLLSAVYTSYLHPPTVSLAIGVEF